MNNELNKPYCTLQIAPNSFSFTATPTLGKAGIPHFMRWEDGKDAKGNRICMTNPLWGETIRKSPKEMIERGEMLRPVVHLVATYSENGQQQSLEKVQSVQGTKAVDDSTYYDELWRCIEQSYDCHSQYVKENSADPTKLAAKLLVTLDSQETMIRLLGGELLKDGSDDGKTVKLRVVSGDFVDIGEGRTRRTGTPSFEHFFAAKPTNMHIFAIASGTGAYIDGEWQGSAIDKGQFLRKLKEVPDTDGAIILYVDMLTEGIDVQGITGFMPMRNIGYSKFKQGMGRASRLFSDDRRRFYAHEIQEAFRDADKYVKPHSAVIIPLALLSTSGAADEYLKIWREVLEEYGAFYEFIISSNRVGGTIKKSVLDSVQELAKFLRASDVGTRKFVQGVFDDPQKLKLDIDGIVAVEFLDVVGVEAARLAFKELNFDTSLGKTNNFTDNISSLKLRAVVNQSYDIDFERMIKTARNSGQGVFADAIKSKFGTIYTPENIVTMTVDLAFKHLDKSLDRTTLKYCDPAAGDGNFFTVLHKRLMVDEQFVAKFPDPIERSRHILTKNIWGFEILKNMWMACRIRLVMIHAEIVKQANADRLVEELTGLPDKLNIYHGNTVKSPKDPEKWEWEDKEGVKFISPDPKIGEGGLLPEELRTMKFDVITGNPPYTHLRNLDNRIYRDYKNQRDLAQVFVRWGLDHLTENGVCSFNTTDAWLNVKTSDGAAETRQLVDWRIREIINSSDISLYSESDGGNITTFLICIGSLGERKYCLNNQEIAYTKVDLERYNFIPNVVDEYHAERLGNKYTPISLNRGKSVAETNKWIRGSIAVLGNYHNYIILAPRHLGSRIPGAKFKLCRQNPTTLSLSGEWKYCEIIDPARAHWLFGCLNTKIVLGVLIRCVRQVSTDGNSRINGDWIVNLDNRKFAELPIPDFDWYETNRPQQHTDFLKWVEVNMVNKDVFLAGIDEQFKILIGE